MKVMKRYYFIAAVSVVFLLAGGSCEVVDNVPVEEKDDSVYVGLDEVAEILSRIPLRSQQLNEVHSAVSSSSDNGYDEEYTMRNLFRNPGAGVGEQESRSGEVYDVPVRQLIEDYVRKSYQTKSASGSIAENGPDAFLTALMDSDMQIYWPFSEDWDGETMPVITFDPEDGSELNVGYRVVTDDDGFRHVEEVMVDEVMAMSEPVWVVNRNSDASYTTLEMLRREDPSWGEGGGNIIVKPQTEITKVSGQSRALILKDFTMKRNYDSWFAGASEFFVKTGYVDDFTASTEAELRLFNPMVTDFMIVVKRSQVGESQPFNAMVMSDWSGQMTHCAFMITEDDGGSKTDWSAKAKVYVAGKSYGVEISFPLNTRDDVVWRGQIASRWLEENSDVKGHFGDVDLTFEIVEY